MQIIYLYLGLEKSGSNFLDRDILVIQKQLVPLTQKLPRVFRFLKMASHKNNNGFQEVSSASFGDLLQ